MKIMVLSLLRAITEEQLKKLFEPFGAVKSCALVTDSKTGTSKGFGFVEMENDTQAKAAIAGLNNKRVQGNRIRVKVQDE
jgi:RNA recognition motif-containing protein